MRILVVLVTSVLVLAASNTQGVQAQSPPPPDKESKLAAPPLPTPPAPAAKSTAPTKSKAALAAPKLTEEKKVESVTKRTLDGVFIDAVEAYPGIHPHRFSLGFGYYPFNAYYQALSVNAAYTYHFNNTLGWEVLNAHYFFTFDTGLTSQLAENHQVEPQSINRVSYLISTAGQYTHTFGKMVVLRDYIRYFQVTGVGGLGLVSTQANKADDLGVSHSTSKASAALQLGLIFRVFISDMFSWTLEVRDNVTPDFSNYFIFGLNTGLSF